MSAINSITEAFQGIAIGDGDFATWTTELAKSVFSKLETQNVRDHFNPMFEGMRFSGFDPEAIMSTMRTAATTSGRNLISDLSVLIAIFYTRGANITAIKRKTKPGPWLNEFNTLVTTYNIQSNTKTSEITLPRITQSMPLLCYILFSQFRDHFNIIITDLEMGAVSQK